MEFDAFPSNLDHTCDDKAQHCNVLLYQETKSAYIESFPKMNDRVHNENGFDIHKVQHIISSKTGEKLCRNVEK